MNRDKRVYGYFSKNNYEYLENTSNRLKQDKIRASKSKILELAVNELRKKEYKEIKAQIRGLI